MNPEQLRPVSDTVLAPGPRGAAAGKPLNTAVLFVDLVSSSEFASVLGLREYAEFVESFADLCVTQCRHFFQTVFKGRYVEGRDYSVRQLGDELIVYLHSGKSSNDVYQLICLAVALKCGWLCIPQNIERNLRGAPSTELAAGIHYGPVWSWKTEQGMRLEGFAISLAKRVESLSREGERFRIFLSDHAFKQVNRRMRNLIFAPRRVPEMKGIVLPVGVHEVVESFVEPTKRMAPDYVESFINQAKLALASNSFDLWIHSCVQVQQEAQHECVTDECFELALRVLNMDPSNAVALYYAAQAHRERGDLETAMLHLEDLTRYWPNLGDGWLELGRLLKRIGDEDRARLAILQARRRGVRAVEERLPGEDVDAETADEEPPDPRLARTWMGKAI